MALFENFPYTNLQNLNLDWLIREMKRLEQGQVLSVNGQTGNVILYQDASVQLPSIESGTSWSFWRNINNRASGIQFTSTGIEWVDGSNRIQILTVNDIPSTAGVLSVNGKAGVVVLIGSDINVSETDQRTIAEALEDIANNYSTLTATVGEHTTAITALQSASAQYGTDITALQSDSAQHGTDITALQIASAQHGTDITALQTASAQHGTDITALQSTSSQLQTTTDQHTSQIAALNNKFEWRSLAPVIGTSRISLPDQTLAKEFIFILRYGTSQGLQALAFTFPIPNLAGIQNIQFTQGYTFANGNGFAQIAFNGSTHEASLANLTINGTDYTSTSQLTCYYR